MDNQSKQQLQKQIGELFTEVHDSLSGSSKAGSHSISRKVDDLLRAREFPDSLVDRIQRWAIGSRDLGFSNGPEPTSWHQEAILLLDRIQNFDASQADYYIDLDQAAALVNRSKKTLSRARRNDRTMPEPDVEGGGGRKHEWKWDTLKPWLEKTYGKKLPVRPPHTIR